MILVKAPLRISICGGGTDLPSYYESFESTFVSAAINKYIYISLHPIFINELILKYSEMERCVTPYQIRHGIIRECFHKLKDLTNKELNSLEICSFADIPAGTGLGSSSTFTVALLKALYTLESIGHTEHTLAEDACQIEIQKLSSPIGKQDQYASAIGGLTKYHIDKQGLVTSQALKISNHHRIDLEEHLLLFFTGYSRDANTILKEQDQATKAFMQKKGQGGNNEMVENLHRVTELGREILQALENGNLNEFGRLMNIHWLIKKKRSGNMSNGRIDEWYELALKNGALGGKLIGAGGGGFLMFLADDKRRLRKVMREQGLQDVPFRFENHGAQVVLHD